MILLHPPSVTTSVNTNLHFTFCSILFFFFFLMLFPEGISTVHIFCIYYVFAWNGPQCIPTYLTSAHLSKSSPAVTSSVEMSSDSSRLHALHCMKVSVYIFFPLSCSHLNDRNWVYSFFIPRNQIQFYVEKVLKKCLEIDGWTESR